MKQKVLKYKLPIIGALLGGIAGYAYWQTVGCSSGQCMITSDPVNSTVYGGAMGTLIFSLFRRDVQEQKENKKRN